MFGHKNDKCRTQWNIKASWGVWHVHTHVAVIMRQVQHTCKMSFGVTGTNRHKKNIYIYSHQKLSSFARLVVEHEVFPLEIGKWQKIRLTMRIHLYVGNFPGVVPVYIYFLTFSCLVSVYLTTWKYCNILSALHLSNLWALSSKNLVWKRVKELTTFPKFKSAV